MPYKTPATCHPNKLQKTADGRCVNCWRRDVYKQFKVAKEKGLLDTLGAEVTSNIEAALGPDVETVKDGGNVMEITKTIAEKVSSLDDLVRVCKIDTSVWDIDRWTCTAHQQGSVPRSTRQSTGDKWARPSTEVVVTQLFGVKVWLKRKTPLVLTMTKLRHDLIADIREAVDASPRAATIQRHRGDYLFEFSPFDLHMGKYAWDEETVTNYDIDIAADLFNASLDYLLSKALAVSGGSLDRVLCVFGNDVCHIDTKRGTTTAGTQMDVDTRYVKVFRRIVEIHRRAIDVLRQVAPVDVVIVSGNHDELTAFLLGEVIAAAYEDDQLVTVDNGPRLRKYYEYGSNLLGFTHGDAERVTELPLIMAREVPEKWARCSSREFHIGHKHITEKHEARGRIEQDYYSDKGVRVRRLPSLSAHDAWHTRHGYMDRRACEAFVFHKTAGYTSQLSFNVDHFSGKKVSK